MGWWVRVFVHNGVVHPLLPFAEIFDRLPFRSTRKIASWVFRAHDATVPEGGG